MLMERETSLGQDTLTLNHAAWVGPTLGVERGLIEAVADGEGA